MALLEVKNVSHRFGENEVLKDINITVELGQIIGIFGRNGSGKSTLLKILFKQLKQQDGEIHFRGKKLGDLGHKDKCIAYLPQNRMLPRELKVRDVIAMCSANGAAQDAIFYAPGIDSISNKYVYQLSHGNLKYLSALLVLNLPHPIIMLDEPFSMVDPLIRERFKALLISKKSDKTILLTDHYYRDVFQISDVRFVLNNGVLQLATSIQDLKQLNYIL